MSNSLYNKEIKCLVCKKTFHTKKVRTSSIRVEKRDADFCTYYKGVNPLLYGVNVCPYCGYTVLDSMMEEAISPSGKQTIKKEISEGWIQREFGDERTVGKAIEAYKLALLCCETLSQKKGILGIICLRLAWLFRFIEDDREETFLRHTIHCFEEAFRYERFPIAKLDEISVSYLLGELNRRIKNYEEAIGWFDQTLRNSEIKRKRKLEIQTREQWRLAKEEYKNTL